MASGGARARSGPPPDPDALRRDRKDDKGWITLPAEGRKGKAPAWPLTQATARERALWNREWKRPQATQWEANALETTVALYVRTLAEAETRMAAVNLRTLVKQLQEELGISFSGLARMRWKISETAAASSASASKPRAGRAGRERFAVVQGGKS